MSNNVMKPPFPPIGGGVGKAIKTIGKIVKTLMDIFKKPAREAGETDSINNHSSPENIDRMICIFSDFKDQVHVKAVEIENAVMEEVNYYTEELQDVLRNHSDKVEKYRIHTKRIERQIDRISSGVKGTIDNELSKKVSLDNSECKEVVKMIPGTKKESAMSAFLNSAMNSALEACCDEIHASLDEIYDDVEDEILGAVEGIQKQNEHLKESFSMLEEEADYETVAKKQMTDAFYLTDVCNAVLEIL